MKFWICTEFQHYASSRNSRPAERRVRIGVAPKVLFEPVVVLVVRDVDRVHVHFEFVTVPKLEGLAQSQVDLLEGEGVRDENQQQPADERRGHQWR